MAWRQLPVIVSGGIVIPTLGQSVTQAQRDLLPTLNTISDVFAAGTGAFLPFFQSEHPGLPISGFVDNYYLPGKSQEQYLSIYPDDFGYTNNNSKSVIYLTSPGEITHTGYFYFPIQGLEIEDRSETISVILPAISPDTNIFTVRDTIINAINSMYSPVYNYMGGDWWNRGCPLQPTLFPLVASNWTIEKHEPGIPQTPYFRLFLPGVDFYWYGVPLVLIYYPPFEYYVEPPSSTKFGGTSVVTGEQALKNLQANHGKIAVFNNNSGLGAYSFVQNQDYPIFQDNLSHYVPWATLKAFVNGSLVLTWDQGSFDLPDSGGQTQKMLPSQLTAIVGELTRVEANTNDFFTKQEHVWEAEARFFDFVVKEIEDRCSETKIAATPGAPTLPQGTTETIQTFGPYIVLTRDSESNKGYKYNNLAGWAYRSLVKKISFEITQRTIRTGANYFTSYLLRKIESQVAVCQVKNLGFAKIIGHGRYDVLGVFAQTDSTPEAYTIPDPCAVVPTRTSTVLLGDSKVVDPSSLLALDTTIDGQLFHLDVPPLVIPPSTILLRDGSPAPIYPTKEGAFVYDLHLKKWGKLRQQYKELLDFSPINSQSSQIYPHEVFGIQAAMLDGNGNFYVFDDKPIESELTYGKIGFYRKGLTAIEELHAQFKKTSTGEIVVESSLDGKTVDPSLYRISSFSNAVSWQEGFSVVAKWFNVKIRGVWDLCYLQFTGHKKGNR